MGRSSKSLCHSTVLPLLLPSFFSVLGTSSSGFGNLVTIGVSFLVCSGSDPHLNPYLAITEINWLGSLSNTKYVFVLLPARNSLLIHFFITFQYISLSKPLIKARRSVVFSCFIRENIRIVDFCLLDLVDGCQQLGKRLNFSPEFQPHYLHFVQVSYDGIGKNHITFPVLGVLQALTFFKSLFICHFLSELST